MPSQWPTSDALPYGHVEATEVARADDKWGWAELFIAIQLLWGVMMFVPGMQAYRSYVRALPFVTSLGGLVYYFFFFERGTGEPLPTSAKWLIASLVLLVLNLLHDTTHWSAGIAQLVFQISIAAPAFWMARSVRSQSQLTRVMWVVFASSFLGSAFGILQVYYPESFLPPEFNNLSLAINPEIIGALTYVGANGRQIIRPPGLSDLPGGAAIAGMTTMVLGLAFGVRRDQRWTTSLVCLAAAAIGMTALYLTQVRSLAIAGAASVGLFALVRFRQGRTLEGSLSLVAGLSLVIGAYLWAVALGGESLSNRFFGLVDEGVFRTFQEQRGFFLRYTLSELLYEFPLGAGLGRWGTMQVYFGDESMWQAPPIHVEIQPTGWLLDGGIPLWLLYGAALVAALRFAYRMGLHGPSETLRWLATVVLVIQLAIVTLCFSGPVFNTQLGIQFWALTAALFGALQAWRREKEEEGHAGLEVLR